VVLGRMLKKALAKIAEGHAAVRAMPWALSLAAHLLLAAILSITGLVIIRGTGEGQTIIPDARLSDTPGSRALRGPSDPTPAGVAAQTAARATAQVVEGDFTPAAPVVGIGTAAGGGGEDEDGTTIIGLGVGAPAALTALAAPAPEPAAGPVTKFFGTGGNAHHIVYLVDWSGSMVAEGRYQAVELELLRSLGDLQPSQDFHIIFFSRGAPLEVPPARLVAAGDDERAAAGRFMRDKLGRPQSDNGVTDPVPALRRAFETLQHTPTSQKGRLIYLLTDGDFADNAAVFAELVKLNAARDVHINTILYATSLEVKAGTAQEMLSGIAATHGGTYKWVSVGE
jgi:hypothetical protein